MIKVSGAIPISRKTLISLVNISSKKSKALIALEEKTAQMRAMLKRPKEMTETILRKTALETDWAKLAQAKAAYAKAAIQNKL